MHVVKRIRYKGPREVIVLDFAGLELVSKIYECTVDSYNVRFGGIQAGWMGERSIPIVVAEGNSSAKSLV